MYLNMNKHTILLSLHIVLLGIRPVTQIPAMSSSVTLPSTTSHSTSPPNSTQLASPIPLISVRLDRSNFLLWKTLILPNLSGLNLHNHLDETTPIPEKTLISGDDNTASVTPNPTYQAWWQEDQRVLAALLTAMTPEVATQMVGLQTAAQVWSAIHSMFAAQNRDTIRHTRLQLHTVRQKDLPAADYFQKMKTLADTLATIGSPISDNELIDYILAGLGPQFGPLAASLTIANNDVILSDFYAYLLSFESLQEQQHNTGEWVASANSIGRFSESRNQFLRRQND